MKDIFKFAVLAVIVFFAFQNRSAASEVIINGSAQFDSSLSEKYMEKHGYVFIEESYYKGYLKTNMFGAKNADVLIKNEYGEVLGMTKTDKEGEFSVAVPKVELYKIIVRFKGNEVMKQVQFPKIKNVILYSGFFKSDTVDGWIAEEYRAAEVSDKDPAASGVTGTSFSRSYR